MTTRISLELVPRSRSKLRAELASVQSQFPGVDTVNIPDLMRFSTRSWEGCAFAPAGLRAIPHVRAIDLNPKEPLPMTGAFLAHGIEEVLIVTGDAPNDMNRRVYNVDAEQAIRRFRRELPHVKVYAGLDPYRQSFAAERDYMERKLEAGAVGFFTQPFFDMRMVEIYAEVVPDGAEVWWGATTVTEEGSLNYWQTRNRAIFPRRFGLELEHDRQFAAELLAFARREGQHAYFMPVKADVGAYLGGIL